MSLMKSHKITLDVQSLFRFNELDQAGSLCNDKHMDSIDFNVDVNVLSNRIKEVVRGSV